MFGNLNLEARKPGSDTVFYKVSGADPKGKSPFVEGTFVCTAKGEDGKPLSTDCMGTVKAVLVHWHQLRRYETWNDDNTKETHCISHNGEQPDPDIASPFCHEMDMKKLEAVLRADMAKSKLKGKALDAEINDRLKVLGDGEKLTNCCDTNGWHLCPMAFNQRTRKIGDCKYSEMSTWFDIERERLFKIELRGANTYMNKKYTSPFRAFQAHLTKNGKGTNMWDWQVVLSPAKGPGGNPVLNITDIQLIEDEVLSEFVTTKAVEAKEDHLLLERERHQAAQVEEKTGSGDAVQAATQ